MRHEPEIGPSMARQMNWSSRDLVTAALLHRVLITRICFGLAAVVGVVTILQAASYSSRATVALPPAGMVTSGLGGVAAQLGLGLGLGSGSRPPAFYVSLVRSDAMMEALVAQLYTYRVNDSTYEGDLVDLLAHAVEPRALALERAADALRDHISVSLVKEAGTIDIGAKFEDPYLAQAVVSQLLGEIDRFNVRERYERASAERSFLAERLEAARAAQSEAEADLQLFLEENRNFHNSPALQVRFEALSREARLRQDLAASINDSYEKARLEESRNTGVLVVVAGPSLPAERDARFLVVRVLAAILLGFALGVGLAWVLEFVRDGEMLGYSRQTAAAAREGALQDLWRPWRLFGVFPSGRGLGWQEDS